MEPVACAVRKSPRLNIESDCGLQVGSPQATQPETRITPEGERFLVEHNDVVQDIFERLRETVRDFAGGAMGELNGAFARLSKSTYKRAWRRGPEDPAIKRVAEILRKAADDIEQVWGRGSL
jgi:hypothetical protein